MATWTRCYRCGAIFQPPVFPRYFWRATCENCLGQLEVQAGRERQALSDQWRETASFWGKVIYYSLILPLKVCYRTFVWLIMSIYGNFTFAAVEFVAFGIGISEGKYFAQTYGLLLLGAIMLGIGAARYFHGTRKSA